MDDYIIILFLYYILSFLKTGIAIATVILSIIIITKKDKNAKFFAFYLIPMSCNYYISSFNTMISRVSANAYVSVSRVTSYVGAALTLAALISVGMYAKRRYDSKAHITVPCSYIGVCIVSTVANMIAVSMARGNGENVLMNNIIVAMTISLVMQCIPYIILVYVFYKNSSQEDKFPNLWKIMFLLTVALALNDLISLVAMYDSIHKSVASSVTALLVEVSPLMPLILWLGLSIYVLRKLSSEKSLRAAGADQE